MGGERRGRRREEGEKERGWGEGERSGRREEGDLVVNLLGVRCI